ncbi:DUF3105 domain-containing protein [Hamadaea sp. NPDC050747]|uniref:DUF3105 domain-containing protein n=1 Tax=Hamadaea sp. NPDC050747 TaxID=3155789 RepID=UPI0034098F4F
MAVAIVAIGVVIAYATRATTAQPAAVQKVTDIAGVVDYRTSTPQTLTRNHKQGVLPYQQSPPVGGDHNPVWQNCTGTVYTAPIANEHAVHSMEHGAVWITYRPGLPADQISVLAAKVTGVQYMLMSPYPDLDAPISVQAWGYQLKLDSATDPRIDQFIATTRITLAPEAGATCTGGITTTGTTPRNVDGGM